MNRRDFLKTTAAGALAAVAPLAFATMKGSTMQTITLTNGVLKPVEMPILGFGTYQIPPENAQKCVEDAISVGYRLIDTAQAYRNEAGVGAAIKTALNGGIPRTELFIETKLWISHANESKARAAFDESLKKLGVDYVDLYIIHQPYNDVFGAWRVMAKLLEEGRVRAIGVSNFYPDVVANFAFFNDIKPAINQIEMHPFFQKADEQALNEKFGIKVQSWASFAEGKNNLFKNEVLTKIGKAYGKTAAQVVLRWLIERGVVVIPKTTRIERMKENFNVFDFALSDSDKKAIAALDTNTTLFLDHRDPARIEWFANLHS